MSTRLTALLVVSLGLGLATAAGADPASHREAALALCEAINMEASLALSIESEMNRKTTQNPTLAQHRAAIETFFRKHMSWEALKDEFVALYMEVFTESELREMTAFYETPTGQKAIEKTPQIVQRGAQIGARRVKQNKAELERLILAGAK
jgi:hypothetical protein